MTADTFPGRSALATLGGETDDWVDGYRIGWGYAEKNAPDLLRMERLSNEFAQSVRRYGGIPVADLRSRLDGLLAGWRDGGGKI